MGSRAQEQFALLTDYDHTTDYSQAFHTLFANIRFRWEAEKTKSTDSQVHSLLMTGASDYQDQVTVAANLAIVAAQSGMQTILVDTDLRKPGLHQRFGLTQEAGLSDLLVEDAPSAPQLANCLQSTFVPNLSVLGAGSAGLQSAISLLSPHFRTIVSGLKDILASSEKQSGIVIYHSAPVLSGADASILSTLVEQTVLTIIVGRTTRTQAKKAQEQLQLAQAKLAGLIMLHP